MIDYEITRLSTPLAIQADQTYGPASLRDAVAGEAFQFGVYMRLYCGAPSGVSVLCFYTTTFEIAEQAIESLLAWR